MTFQVSTVVINSGQTISASHFAMRNARHVALWAPTLTACSVHLLGSPDTTSANFVRVMDPLNPGNDYAWGANTGSRAITLTDILNPIANVKIETSAAQADERAFIVMFKIA